MRRRLGCGWGKKMPRYYSCDHKPVELLAGLAETACPCCGESSSRTIGQDNGFAVVKCRAEDCGMVYVNPRPTPQGLKEFYRTYYPEQADVSDRWEDEMHLIFDEVCDWMMQGRNAPGDVLDVGCSYGHFLSNAARRGWRTTGIEPSPGAAAMARNLTGGPVQECGIESAELTPGSFDAVVSLYVLEHVPDPRSVIKRIYDVLLPSGQAIIRVPYAEPFMPFFKLLRRPLMLAPMHLNDFSPKVMSRIGREVGFSRIEVEVGCPRRSSDMVERVGAFVLGNAAKFAESCSRGRLLLPLAGAFSYRLWKS